MKATMWPFVVLNIVYDKIYSIMNYMHRITHLSLKSWYTYRMKYFWVLAVFLLPQWVSASVFISEVAWMGTSQSASDEWIELCTIGDAQSLDGWTLKSDDAGLNILLSGQIASQSCYVIERTDDTTLPERSAELVASFGSGLSNTGENIRLINSQGAVVDSLVSGSGWELVGGNSTTKETPQRSGATWVTLAPTPGVAAAVQEHSAQTESTVTAPLAASLVTVSGKSSGVSKKPKQYRLEVEFPERVSPYIEATYVAKVFDSNGDEASTAEVLWNMGDGMTHGGASVRHTYDFPGTYTIYVTATVRGKTFTTMHTLDVLSGDVRILESVPGQGGYVAIESKQGIDISGWRLQGTTGQFVFPSHTMLHPKKMARFANRVTGIVDHRTLSIHRPDNTLAYAYAEKGDRESDAPVFVGAATLPAIPPATPSASSKTPALDTERLIAAPPREGIPSWMYLGLAMVGIVALGVITYVSKYLNPAREIDEEAAKYALMEMESNLDGK